MKVDLGKFVTVLLLLAFSFTCFPEQTLTVPDDYPTIQVAIDAAQPGDTVYVRAGVYRENLVIDKPLSLVGEDRTTTIIRSLDSEQHVIIIKLSQGNVYIAGIKVSGGNRGIYVHVDADVLVTLKDVIVSENHCGVEAFGDGALTVSGSYFIDNESIGLLLRNATAVVKSNEILLGIVGLLLVGTVDASLDNNLIGLCWSAIDTYIQNCGWANGEQSFSGDVAGTGNRVYGLNSDLCPENHGSQWPGGFVDEVWQKTVARIGAAFDQGAEAHSDQDYQRALGAFSVGLAQFGTEIGFPLLKAYLQQNIGVVYDKLGRHQEALAAYQSARSVFVDRQMEIDVANVDTNIGNTYADLGHYQEALAAYQSARSVFVDRQMEIDVANVDTNIGNTYADLGHYQEALVKYEAARAVYVKQEMIVDIAQIDTSIGNAYADLGRYQEALAKYEAARAVYVKQEMIVDIAQIDTSIGIVYWNLGRYEEALTKYEAARAVYLKQEMIVDIAQIDTNIGNVYTDLGRYEEALAVYQSARGIFVDRQMEVNIAHVDTNIGNVYTDLGRYEEALAAFKSACAVYVDRQMEVNIANLNTNIGNVYTDLGRYEEALAVYQSARGIFVDRQMEVNIAHVDTNIGNVYTDLGRYEEALAKYDAARATFVELGSTLDTASVDKNRGAAYTMLRRFGEAIAAYVSARAVYVSHGMEVAIAGIDQNIGVVYWALGRYEEALQAYEEALDLLDETPPLPCMIYSHPATRWMLLSNLGVAHESCEQWAEARQAYKDSIAVIESLRGYMKSEELKTAWQETTQEVYERLIDLLYRMGKGSSAFTYAERCRARTFLDALYQGSIAPNQLISPEAGISSGAVDPKAIDEAVTDARDSLQGNEAVLEYMVTDSGVYLWVITKEGIGDPSFIEYEREQLMNDVITLRKTLESANPDQITMTELLTSFYDKLVKESLAKLPDGVDTLILIPSGPLWYLPFSALVMTDQELPTGPGTTRHPYLVERYTLAYLPSLASLSSLTKGETEAAGGVRLLALADPELSPDQLRASEGSKCGEEQSLDRYEQLVVACQDFAKRLVGEEQEEQCVYAGKEAQEARAHEDIGRRVVVYAAHGQFNPYVPLQSKLLLASGGEAANLQTDSRVLDGNYHAWEALLTDYRGTELVILAACETLLPHLKNMRGTMAVLGDQECDQAELTPQQLEQIVVGDEVVGLARAFLSSGAEAVLGTLWLVNPTAIGKLLTSMAEYHKNEGYTWVQALTKAQRELIKGNTFSNPWFWAPYQLIGRWR